METTPWSGLRHSPTRKQVEARRQAEVAPAKTSNLNVGTPQTLLTARATQQMLNIVREEFDTALLQARRDGWSLRALSDALGLSYTSIKRYSQRAVDRGH